MNKNLSQRYLEEKLGISGSFSGANNDWQNLNKAFYLIDIAQRNSVLGKEMLSNTLIVDGILIRKFMSE